MVPYEHSQFQTSLSLSMAKHGARTKAVLFLSDGLLFASGALVAFLMIWALLSFVNPNPSSGFLNERSEGIDFFGETRLRWGVHAVNLHDDPDGPTFYDDPELSYSIGGQEIENWDEKRRDWLKHHPLYAIGASDWILREPTTYVCGIRSHHKNHPNPTMPTPN
ncbi:hypothetical protein CsSME_00051941 [Camellia sinensis var. sinensis]